MINKQWLLGSALLVSGLLPAAGWGFCECTCVHGQYRAVCTSNMDIPPICPPAACPLTPPPRSQPEHQRGYGQGYPSYSPPYYQEPCADPWQCQQRRHSPPPYRYRYP